MGRSGFSACRWCPIAPVRGACAALWVAAASLAVGERNVEVADAPALTGPAAGSTSSAAIDGAIRRATLDQFWGAVLVVRDGEVLLAKGYGTGRVGADGTPVPIDRTSLFELASVTKPLTATLVMRLVRSGALALDSSIGTYLDGVPDARKSITIRHLLNHTSGLGAPEGAPGRDERDAAVAFYLSTPLGTTPGTRYEYSNIGYMLLAAIVERVTGLSFEEAMRGHVYEPAGMRSAGTCGEAILDRSRAVARESGLLGADASGQDAVDWPYPMRWAYVGCGGAVACLDDLVALHQALRGDTLFDAATRREVFSPGLGGWGLGWSIGAGPLGPFAEHSGGVRGFSLVIRHWLETDLFIAVLTNEASNPFALADRALAALDPRFEKSASAILRLGMCAPGEWSRPVGDAAIVEVERAGGGARPVTLRVRDPAQPDAALDVTMSPGMALELASAIEASLATIEVDGGGVEAVPAVRATLYTGAYKGEVEGSGRDEHVRIAGRKLGVKARPGTFHPKPGDDHRITVYLEDPTRSFLPVFIEMGRAPATAVAKRLNEVAGQP